MDAPSHPIRTLSKIALFLFSIFSFSEIHASSYERTQILMGDIPVHITIKTSPSKKQKAYQAMEEAFQEVHRLTDKLSEWSPTSETTWLNQNAGHGFLPVSRELMTLLNEARKISERTNGGFDITFASQNKKVSFRDVILIPELGLAKLASKKVKIGISGIAKGFIVDHMVKKISRHGFHDFVVDAGDLYVSGHTKMGIKNPDNPSARTGKAGYFAVQSGANPDSPPNPHREVIMQLSLKNQAISTSGDYERGAHIQNQHTQKPAHFFKSVTVIAPKSVVADALATGIFASGKIPPLSPQECVVIVKLSNKIDREGNCP